jgi:MinD-like ATPase involved in chromosome partitioning or flagellar assembly
MSAAIDSGNPVVLDSPRSRLTRSYHELASALADAVSVTNESQPPQASASR